jgi:hypothetical protein
VRPPRQASAIRAGARRQYPRRLAGGPAVAADMAEQGRRASLDGKVGRRPVEAVLEADSDRRAGRGSLMCAAESAEQLWNAEVENDLGSAMEAAPDGYLHDRDAHVAAIRDGSALHLVRSLRYLEVDRAAVVQTIDNVRRTAPVARRELLEAEFQRRHGLAAAGAEALATLLEGPLAKWLSLGEKGVIARAGIEAMFRRVRDTLGPLEVEVWHVPSGHELLISDSPAIAFRYSGDYTRIQANVAVGDASGIALPLARDCLAVIGPQPKDEELLPSNVEVFNRLQVQEARQYVYYHPGGRLKAFMQAATRAAA